jgi:hypothetical protein
MSWARDIRATPMIEGERKRERLIKLNTLRDVSLAKRPTKAPSDHAKPTADQVKFHKDQRRRGSFK